MKKTRPLLYLILIGLTHAADGAGFALYTYGQPGHAMMNATVAHAEGPAALAFNPATLTDLDDSSFSAGASWIHMNKTFQSATTSQTLSTTQRDFLLPSFFYGARHKQMAWAAGLYPNFGLGTHWPADWEGHYQSISTEMTSVAAHGGMAWKCTDKLSIGGGLIYMRSEAEMENDILTPAGDVRQTFTGEGDQLGFNLGLNYTFTTNWSLGASYISGFDVEYAGTAAFTPELPSVLQTTGGTATMNLPNRTFIGLAWQPNSIWLIEAMLRHESWSSYETINITFEQPVAGSTSKSLPRQWSDTMAYILGVRYQWTPHLKLYGGLLYETNPVPDATLEPTQTFGYKRALSLGSAYSFRSVECSLSALWADDTARTRSIAEAGNPAGTYTSKTLVVSLAASFHW